MFEEFGKIPRLSRECVVTEKIDGTNAQVYIVALGDPNGTAESEELIDQFNCGIRDGFAMMAGSRNRFIAPEADNFGFAAWVKSHAKELWALGPGRHFGEWWGSGIQRGYGLQKGEKRFSLFNVARWHAVGAEPYISVSSDSRVAPKSSQEAPACCSVVPVLYRGEFQTHIVDTALECLRIAGSVASQGFKPAEGVIVYHVAANSYFKKTIEKDEEPKGRHGSLPVAS